MEKLKVTVSATVEFDELLGLESGMDPDLAIQAILNGANHKVTVSKASKK